MAKSGFWLRGARGKLAGASMAKGSNGQTIIREIVTPKNPRTEKQLWQRAIMATVMSAYAAGKEIFDHSFQGFAVGSACQREFLSRNARRLRQKFINDTNYGLIDSLTTAKATGPACKTIVPNGYIVSTGTYTQSLFSETPDVSGDVVIGVNYHLPAIDGDETVAQFAARYGMTVGDIYTFVFVTADTTDVLFTAPGATNYKRAVQRGRFGFVRLIVKDYSGIEILAKTATYSDLFQIETNLESTNINEVGLKSTVEISRLSDFNPTDGYSIGLIRSRFDQDLRSNTEMIICNPDRFGLSWIDVIPSWQQGAAELGDPGLTLEGSNAAGLYEAGDPSTGYITMRRDNPEYDEDDPQPDVPAYFEYLIGNVLTPRTFTIPAQGGTPEHQITLLTARRKSDGAVMVIKNVDTTSRLYTYSLAKAQGYGEYGDTWNDTPAGVEFVSVDGSAIGAADRVTDGFNARQLINTGLISASVFILQQ